MARVATGSTAEIKAPNVKLGREGMGGSRREGAKGERPGREKRRGEKLSEEKEGEEGEEEGEKGSRRRRERRCEGGRGGVNGGEEEGKIWLHAAEKEKSIPLNSIQSVHNIQLGEM